MGDSYDWKWFRWFTNGLQTCRMWVTSVGRREDIDVEFPLYVVWNKKNKRRVWITGITMIQITWQRSNFNILGVETYRQNPASLHKDNFYGYKEKKCMNTSFIISTISKNQCLKLLSLGVIKYTHEFEVSCTLTQFNTIAGSNNKSWDITVQATTPSEGERWCQLYNGI